MTEEQFIKGCTILFIKYKVPKEIRDGLLKFAYMECHAYGKEQIIQYLESMLFVIFDKR
tara:strand:+ start:365 stop:541 length:177 start_codon:yes stop_codon:yes gene_type:complete